MPEKRAKLILEVAQAIGTQLEMAELLAALNNTLQPIVHFDAVAIMILEGDVVRLHWAHLEGFPRNTGECFESVFSRYASTIKVEAPPMKLLVTHHPISEIMKSGRPYVARDLEVHMGFDTDAPLLNFGFQSYIDLPLSKQGQLIGTIKFLSKEKGNYTDYQVHLLQDIANIVAIAVSNALAYEEIKSLKEQL